MKDFMFVFRGPTPEDLKLSPEESQASMPKMVRLDPSVE